MATIQETLNKKNNRYKKTEAFYTNILHQLTIPPIPPVKQNVNELDCEKLKINNENTIKIRMSNIYDLTDKNKHMPIIYNEKPIGFISDIVENHIDIVLWTKYISIVPMYSMLDKYLEKGIELNIVSLELLMKEK